MQENSSISYHFNKEKREENKTLESFLLELALKDTKEATNTKIFLEKTLEIAKKRGAHHLRSHVHK